MTNPFDDPDYITIQDIHAILPTENITDKQRIEQVMNVIAAWSMTGEEV